MKNGENYFDGGWYLYDATTKQLKNGWQIVSDNRKVYYDVQTNIMKHGEAYIDGAWYYFDPVDGHMHTGWVKLSDGRQVYYDNQGKMVHGTLTLDNKTYHLNNITGALMNQ